MVYLPSFARESVSAPFQVYARADLESLLSKSSCSTIPPSSPQTLSYSIKKLPQLNFEIFQSASKFLKTSKIPSYIEVADYEYELAFYFTS